MAQFSGGRSRFSTCRLIQILRPNLNLDTWPSLKWNENFHKRDVLDFGNYRNNHNINKLTIKTGMARNLLLVIAGAAEGFANYI